MKKNLLLFVGLTLVVVIVALAGCGGGEATPFSMQVIPEKMEDSIAGQRCVFLVTVEDSSEGNAVNILATAPGSTVTVNPQAITAEQVAEVMVIPDNEYG